MSERKAKPSFPAAPEQVDAEWLAARVSSGDASLADLSYERVGTGQVGLCVRFELTWQSEDPDEHVRPSSVIGKFSSNDPESLAAGVQSRCYEREVGFYRLLQRESGLRTPSCFHAQISESKERCVLLLEDLRGAEPGDQLEGCTANQARAVIDELALLHASWWGSRRIREIDWLESASAETTKRTADLCRELASGFEARFEGRLNPPVFDLVSRLPRLIEKRGNYRAAAPDTLVHRDCRCDNLLFAAAGERRSRVCTVDWQTIGRAPGAQDLAYFLGGSLRTSVRRKLEQRLVRAYHSELMSRGVEDYALDDCWRDYRWGSIGGLIMAVVASMTVGATERGDEMFAAMARRHAAHALDLDVDALAA